MSERSDAFRARYAHLGAIAELMIANVIVGNYTWAQANYIAGGIGLGTEVTTSANVEEDDARRTNDDGRGGRDSLQS